MEEPRVDVCVATYRRNELLEKLLDSLRAQRLDGLRMGVRVVDNDERGYARPVIDKFERSLRVSYVIEPRRNISYARNAAIEGCDADFVAFIDDDEIADPTWLQAHYDCIETFRAEAVMGPIIKYGPSTFALRSGYFDQPKLASGEERGFETRTGNAFVRWTSNKHRRFDPAYGLTGGEDTKFFEEIKRDGGRVVWCDNAITREYTAPSQASVEWVIQRNYRAGLMRGRQAGFHQRPTKDRIRAGSRAALHLATEVVSSPVHVLNMMGRLKYRFPKAGIRQLANLAFETGKLAAFVGLNYEEYNNARATRGKYEE